MNSLDFVNNYHKYLEEISFVVKPELQPMLEELKKIDPHDLVQPDTWFSDENGGRGLVWKQFLLTIKEKEKSLKGNS